MDALRSQLDAASEPVRSAAWAFRERVIWGGVDRLAPLIEIARWPFERIAWAVERLIVWPLQERAAGRGPSVPRGSLAPAGAIVAGLVVLGIVLTTGSGSRERVVVEAAPTAAPEPAVTLPETTSGAVLHGAPPTLGLGPGNDLASASGAAGNDSLAALSGGDAAGQTPGETGATTSSGKPVPAGPAAMRVARRFAEAFVFYEIGRRADRAETVFEETASPALAEALVERPPRLPASGKVPKAKVLNLVPGPRSGRAYTVSVSLLRIGVTSELRLEMQKSAGNWAVTDVRG